MFAAEYENPEPFKLRFFGTNSEEDPRTATTTAVTTQIVSKKGFSNGAS